MTVIAPEAGTVGCQGCGRPLSRYNGGALCGACSAGNGGQPAARTGDIGARLRVLRRQRGMSLTVLSGLCGVSAAYLSMVENGKRNLDRWSMILALADALKVPPAELALESTTDPEPRPKRAGINDPGLPSGASAGERGRRREGYGRA